MSGHSRKDKKVKTTTPRKVIVNAAMLMVLLAVFTSARADVKLPHIVNQYFMTQRIKPVNPSNAEAYQKYLSELEMLHQMLVLSMKCKQTTDQTHVDRLRAVTADFRDSYLGEDAEHTH